MFKKKPNIKPLAPLRSSDRRKLADEIIKNYGIPTPSPAEGDHAAGTGEMVAEHSPATPTLAGIRVSLVPENALSAKFTTTAGPELRPVSGTIYAGTHSSEELRILWFRRDDHIFPSVYTLWRNPTILPLVHTHEFVMQKLETGAPLMIPGLTNGPPFSPKATKNAIVAIATAENPDVPLVVGICEIDVSSLGQVQGQKGHAVRGEHWYGDEIWAWSTSGKPGMAAPERIDVPQDESDAGYAERSMRSLQLEGPSEDRSGHNPSKQLPKPQAHEEISSTREEEQPLDDDHELTTKEIDHAFWQAFIYGVHQAKAKDRDDPHHGMKFPLSQSVVISQLVLPFLPAFTPRQTASLNIKKTSWKNARKFIKALDKALLVKSKDRDGGECVILDIDFNDQAVVSFVPYRLPKKTQTGDVGGSTNAKSLSNNMKNPSIGQVLHRLQLYRPKEALSTIFAASDSPTHAYYLATELRPIITAYIEQEDLIETSNKRLVKMNPVLAHAVFNDSSKSHSRTAHASSLQAANDQEILAKGSVARDLLNERIITQCCSPFFIILRNDETRDGTNVKPRAGLPPKLQITLETRSGNKVVTKLSGQEEYHITSQGIADELQKVCASSTSLTPLAGSSPKAATGPAMEIMVQGPQREAVLNALEKRGVKRDWVDVVDKTKGKKK